MPLSRLATRSLRLFGLLVLVAALAGCAGFQRVPETRPVHLAEGGFAPSSADAAPYEGDAPAAVPRADAATVRVLTVGISEANHGSRGIVSPADLTVSRGTGRVTIDAELGMDEEMRRSILDAAEAAAAVAELDASRYDFAVHVGRDAGHMSGPSAGAPFALGFYVALYNLESGGPSLQVPEFMVGTGTIARNGEVGPVGGIPIKAASAAGLPDSLFVYPDAPVYGEGGWAGGSIDMDDHCAELRVHCVEVESLSDLVGVVLGE